MDSSGPYWPKVVLVLGNTQECFCGQLCSLLAKGGVTVLGNTRGVTVDSRWCYSAR